MKEVEEYYTDRNLGIYEFGEMFVDVTIIGIYWKDKEGNYHNKPRYTECLDSLVPVWGRLSMFHCKKVDFIGEKCGFSMHSNFCIIQEVADTVQEAAALATYKAIKQLTKEEK